MQYKEKQMNEKAILKISADGNVMSCAKGVSPDECGYTGGKVCGKCGAMAVMQKAKMVKPGMDEDEENMEEDTPAADIGVEEMPEADMAEEEMPDEEEMPMDDEEDEDMGKGYGGMGQMVTPKKRNEAKKRRLQSMGMKSLAVAEEGFLCAIERKMHALGGEVCAMCPGGCAPEGNLPTILEVEGLAENMFGGKVLDSGYGYASDLFLVEMERKDGKVIEVIFDGTTAEVMGWQALNNGASDLLSQKSAQNGIHVIGMDEAARIAVKSVPGVVTTVEADQFDGIDAWAVEIEGKDGNSYDVYVALNGEELGHDIYSQKEAAEIESEAAHLRLKRAYTDTEREVMADRGMALPDGSFPIRDEDDLRNAVQAFGRAKDKEAAKRHIMKRARVLGMEEVIPPNWRNEGKAATETVAADNDVAEDDSFLATLMEFEAIATEAEIEDL